jgi:hypothetical protein
VPGLIVTVIGVMRGIIANLAPASGSQDHTTSPSAANITRQLMQSRPSHPAANVRDDRETPLLWSGMAVSMDLICPTTQAQYFCAEGWTTQISLKSLTKIGVFAQAICGRGSNVALDIMAAPCCPRRTSQRGIRIFRYRKLAALY